ncbi:MAG: hypothetical protein AAB556_02220 [Patescibacteria group bacterium]
MTDEYALTLIRDTNLDWQLHPLGGFVAIMNGITIRATSVFLTMSKDFKTMKIHKSKAHLFKQPTELDQLIEEISNQAATRCLEHNTKEYDEKLRKELLKQLTGLNI